MQKDLIVNNKKGDKKVLAKNTIALMIIQVLNYVIPFITLPYVSRIFEVDKFGVIFFAQSMVDYLGRFIMFGFSLSAVRMIAINRDDKNKINSIVNSVLCGQVLLIIVCFILLAIIIYFIPKFRADAVIYYYSFLGVVASAFLMTWFYQGMEKMKFITFLNVITRAISLILIFTVIKKAEDYWLYPLLNSSALVVTAIISSIFARKCFGLKFKIESFKNIWDSLVYSSEFFLSQIAITLDRQTNVFVLGVVCASTTVAYYCAADKIFMAVFVLYTTFVNALFPYMSKNKDIVFYKKMLKYLIIFIIGLTIVMMFLAKPIILLFYSSKYIASVPILHIFMCVFVFNALVSVLGYSLLGAFGYTRETNTCYVLGGIYNAVGLFILYIAHSINIYTIAILASSVYIVMFIHRIYYIRKYKLLS